jgi:hypothetical protein
MKIANEYNGKFCLAIHYHSFRSEAFQNKFYKIIEYAQTKLDPDFVTAEKLFD